jgi:lipopolysaccharide biosynthesis regulator YciM
VVFGRRRRKPGPEETQRAWRRAIRAAVERDWRAAETWLERIVEADSGDLQAYHALARLYRDQGAVGRAIRMHQNLLLRSDLGRAGRADALRELARDFEAGGYVERAAATYEELLGETPRDAEVLERLVSLLHAQREYPRALALVRRLRRRDRARGTALEVAILLDQADALHASGDHDGARAAIKRCLRRDRSCGAAWTILGRLEAERGRGARALAAWKRGALADAEAAVDLYPKIAAGYAAQGRPETFEEFLQSILQERPFDHAARIALARNRASHGQVGRAVEELSRAIEVAPHELALRTELGRQLLASGQEGEALKAYAALLDELDRGPDAAEEEETPS